MLEDDRKLPVSVRWVDVNNGTQAKPEVRCRLVARDFKGKHDKDREDLFAATPSLDVKRALFSRAATTRTKRGAGSCCSLTRGRRTLTRSARRTSLLNCLMKWVHLAASAANLISGYMASDLQRARGRNITPSCLKELDSEEAWRPQ